MYRVPLFGLNRVAHKMSFSRFAPLIVCTILSLVVYPAKAAGEESAHRVPQVITPAEIEALASVLHATNDIRFFTLSPVSIEQLVSRAVPRNQPNTSSYSTEYKAFLAECKVGGKIIHFTNSRSVAAEGYALFRDGKLFKTLVTSVA